MLYASPRQSEHARIASSVARVRRQQCVHTKPRTVARNVARPGFVRLDVPHAARTSRFLGWSLWFIPGTSVTNVMANNHQYAVQIALLNRTAAETRLRAVECQLSMAFTLCAIADTEIRYSRRDEAIMVLNKVRLHAEMMRIHVDEPKHVPSTAVSDLRRQLTQLEKRANEIELSLSSW